MYYLILIISLTINSSASDVSEEKTGRKSTAESQLFSTDVLLGHICSFLPSCDLSNSFICSQVFNSLDSKKSFMSRRFGCELLLSHRRQDRIVKLFPSFKFTTSLQVLNVSVNGIDDAGASSLAAELHHVPLLQALNLGGNHIGAAGASSLAAELHHLPALQELYLWSNGIGAAGVNSIKAIGIKTFCYY